MAIMSRLEAHFCASTPWRLVGRRVCTWAVQDAPVRGEVLEVGCGAGDSAVLLAGRFPAMRLQLVDVDPDMVARAKARTATVQQVTGVSVGDATGLPHADGRFDTVVGFLMLHHVLDWPAAVQEAHRVLRPGGWFIGYDLLNTPTARAIHTLDRSRVQLFSAAQLGEELRAAGFQAVDIGPAAAGLIATFRAQAGLRT